MKRVVPNGVLAVLVKFRASPKKLPELSTIHDLWSTFKCNTRPTLYKRDYRDRSVDVVLFFEGIPRDVETWERGVVEERAKALVNALFISPRRVQTVRVVQHSDWLQRQIAIKATDKRVPPTFPIPLEAAVA